MKTLHGKKAEDFIVWLMKARHVIPGATTIQEAREIWEQEMKKKELQESEAEKEKSI